MESQIFSHIPQDIRLIETFAWQPGQGAILVDLHLDRMEASAKALNLGFDRDAALALVLGLSGDRALRCRLTLGRDQDFDLTSVPMPPSVGEWVVGLASERLDSHDLWLRHKTTNRSGYDRTRANLPKGIDEMLFMNERDELCEGTISNLFVQLQDGRKVTPPLASGLLPGVLRGQLLSGGGWSEQVLFTRDLRDARGVWVGNALRGLIPVRFLQH